MPHDAKLPQTYTDFVEKFPELDAIHEQVAAKFYSRSLRPKPRPKLFFLAP